MPKLHVHTKFTLRHDDGTSTDYVPGTHDFDDKLADHWYVKLHTKDPETVTAAVPEDSQALDALEADLVEKERSLAEVEAKLNALAAELEARAGELDARDKALAARESDLLARAQAFEAAQRGAERSAEKTSVNQQKPGGGRKS